MYKQFNKVLTYVLQITRYWFILKYFVPIIKCIISVDTFMCMGYLFSIIVFFIYLFINYLQLKWVEIILFNFLLSM